MAVPRGKVGNSQHFPTNLHVLLDEAEKGNHSHIVSWCSQGHAFKIHDNDALVPLLAKYFRQTKFKSFLRQLQSYDFHRIARGSDKGVVSHPLFVRGRRSLCFRMSRKPTGSLASQSSGVPLHHSPPQSSSPASASESASASASAMYLTPVSAMSSVLAMDLHSMNDNNHYTHSSTAPPRAVLSNNIMPLRKINSAPVLLTSINDGNGCGGMMRSNNNNHDRLATMNSLSGINNETFQYQQEEHSLQEGMEEPLSQHHQQHNHSHSHSHSHSQNHQGLQVGMGMKKMKRRASATATMGSAHSVGPFHQHQQMTKRLSASATAITSEQRERLLQCANIDYSSSTNGGRILPQEAFLMSIKESSPAGVLDGSNSSVAPILQLSQQVMIPTVQEVQSSGAQQQLQVELVQQQHVVYQPQYQQQQVQVQYLQEPQQYQQQQQVQHRQEPPHHQIQQVHHAQQHQQEPQPQHQQVQHVDVRYQQEPQQQQQQHQAQLVYRQHQVQVPYNQVQVQQVKQHSGVHQMGSWAPQQQQQDQYQSAKLQLARPVQQIQQQQKQIQNQNQNVQYELSQCDQQQHELLQQQQQQDPYHIVQNQQKMIPQLQQQQLLVQHLRVQNNGPVESRQVCSTGGGGSDSGCHGHCHVHPRSPVCSHQQQHPSNGYPEMAPSTLALYDAVAAPSSNKIDLSFSATQFKYDSSDEKNNNGSDCRNNFPHGRDLPALKFSASFEARDGGTSTSIGNISPYLPSRSWSTKTTTAATVAAEASESRYHMVNTAETNNVNNHNHNHNHQDVALVAEVSLSKIQHMDHMVHPTTASNGVGISNTSPPQSNGNGGGYRTTLQVTTTTNTTAPQQNTTTIPSPSMSQYHQVGGGGGGGRGRGCQTTDTVHSYSCTQPHHSCAVTVTNTPISIDDFDTVDFLLLDGGGCEEWELRPGELKEESNQYYEHFSDPCLSNQQE
jgi:hypothetical protein